MIQLIMLLLLLLAVLMLFRLSSKMKAREATLEEARTVGLQEASLHINNPILLEDYSQAKGLEMEVLTSFIEEGKMPYYLWHQYTFVENRELAYVRK